MVGFLLDTCVVSETSKDNPDLDVMLFLATEDDVVLPMGAVIEFEMGIRKKHENNPVKYRRLVAWLDGLLANDMPVLETNVAIARKYGEMRSCKVLNHLFMTPANAKIVKGGQDVHNAAAAIVSRRSIVTFDVYDYLTIHGEFPLPGLYNPKLDHWHVQPGDKTIYNPEQGLISLKMPFIRSRIEQVRVVAIQQPPLRSTRLIP